MNKEEYIEEVTMIINANKNNAHCSVEHLKSLIDEISIDDSIIDDYHNWGMHG
jgi:hypothetical protein|tara:strand:+ start:189 stop:347 length:159 start_codon:yes stop_codon:yes gene_type:complete